jgi:hypothetical protein
MNYFLLYSALCLYLISCQPAPPGTGFDEPDDPNPFQQAQWDQVAPGLNVAFGSVDQRYEYQSPPSASGKQEWSGSSWRGERKNLQLKIWSSEPVKRIRVSGSSLFSDNGGEIDEGNIGIYPVRYLLTDEFLSGCGWRDKDTIPAYLAADMLENNQLFNLGGNTLRPVWLTIDIPADAPAGNYSGKVVVSYRGGRDIELPVSLRVHDLKLPPPSEWAFHLDLWQNPFAVARYYDVEPWSEEHWELLPPYLTMLANAGQKCITASILDRPWGGQTYDPFGSMIGWTHKGNGEWEYDYSVFDRWVNTAMESGITRQINCYSMVPWGNLVRYFDNDSTDYVTQMLEPGSAGYEAVWRPFLEDFRDHLKARGWLDITLIAMDERGLDEMKSMVALLKDVAPEFKIALAGNYLAELNDDLYDLCVHIHPQLEKELISERVERGMPTTFYTMCARPEHPNNFTFSPPAEQAWLGWHASALGFSGFLRWAYNSWVEDPLRDSRFRTWPAGDTYQVYPGPRSSIRFERLREGIQDYEKILIVRDLLESRGDSMGLSELDAILEHFSLDNVTQPDAAHWLEKGQKVLDDLSGNLGNAFQ